MRESRRLKGKFKGLIERNKWFRYVPNSLTLCNSLCGFAAILNTLQAYYHIGDPKNIINVMVVSSWIIICAMVFDALDGFAARIFNAASMHGIQMDSLADMVTFGVAPAVIAAILTHCLKEEMSRFQNILVYGCCSIYISVVPHCVWQLTTFMRFSKRKAARNSPVCLLLEPRPRFAV